MKKILKSFLLSAGLSVLLFAKNTGNDNITRLINQLKQLENSINAMKIQTNKNDLTKEIQKIENEANLLQQKIILLTEQKQYNQNIDMLKPALKKALKSLYFAALRINNFNKKVFLPYQSKIIINNKIFYIVNKDDLENVFNTFAQKNRNINILKGIYLEAVSQNNVNAFENGITRMATYIQNNMLNINNAQINNQIFITNTNNTVFLDLKRLKRNCKFTVNKTFNLIIFKRCDFWKI